MSGETQRSKAQRLGMRSPFVLAKIGYDLQQEYKDLIEQPLPEDIAQAANRLPHQPTLQVVNKALPSEAKPEKSEAGRNPEAPRPWWRFW